MLRIAAVSGGLHAQSNTTRLVRGIVDGLGLPASAEQTIIELHPLSFAIAGALTGAGPAPDLRTALGTAEGANLLIAASPVYRGSFTGLFKSFFDLVHHDALAGKRVMLAASGGDDQHSLVTEHQLRPLFAFFRSATLPVAVYARASDFEVNGDLTDSLKSKIDEAIEAARPFLPAMA